MLIFFHGGFPPIWVMAIIALLSLASDGLILYGVVFFLTKWRLLERWIKIVLVLMVLFITTAGTMVGYFATIPFGLFGGLPALFFFNIGEFWTSLILIFGGCLLNALGFIGIFGFFVN